MDKMVNRSAERGRKAASIYSVPVFVFIVFSVFCQNFVSFFESFEKIRQRLVIIQWQRQWTSTTTTATPKQRVVEDGGGEDEGSWDAWLDMMDAAAPGDDTDACIEKEATGVDNTQGELVIKVIKMMMNRGSKG